jgi:CHASE3 domain sensor protein
VAFGSAILALLIMGAISYRARIMSIESDQWVRHTHEALESLPNLLKTVESPNRASMLVGSIRTLNLFLHLSALDRRADFQD